jgi:glycosyltransferase involved in cell wall biosynthesis
MVSNLARALRARSRRVVVFSLYDKRTPLAAEIEAAGVPVVHLGKKHGLDLVLIDRLAAGLTDHGVDVVHTHLHVLKYAVPAARRAKGHPRIIHTFHSVADRETALRVARLHNRLMLRSGGVIPVALTTQVQESIVKQYGIRADLIPIVHNGIDVDRFDTARVRRTDGLKLLHVGRFHEAKNHHFLLDVFTLLKSSHPDLSLTLVGDGPLKDEIATRVEVERISNVEFAGEQQDVARYYSAADVFVLPSRYEGAPISIIEAMASGLPIVASNVGGVPTLVHDGENGLLSELNVSAFASRIQTFIGSPDVRERFGRRSRERARGFSSDTMAEQYEHVYFD